MIMLWVSSRCTASESDYTTADVGLATQQQEETVPSVENWCIMKNRWLLCVASWQLLHDHLDGLKWSARMMKALNNNCIHPATHNLILVCWGMNEKTENMASPRKTFQLFPTLNMLLLNCWCCCHAWACVRAWECCNSQTMCDGPMGR